MNQDIWDDVLTAWGIIPTYTRNNESRLSDQNSQNISHKYNKGKYNANDTAWSDSSLTSRISAYL